ncbi:hypothetical protein [Bradyrhizobium sp. SZCCHNS3002]|uniref:hypothetical protein n=1 Tax=Bradyrhizobium sp. SZCCHNS3002 TaxID=3057310 RepID=UPI0028E673B4|nr:hypothetical protein [Bradyrhizobium sp. SZCCHNS3002]
MLYWTIAELMHKTGNELCDLANYIEHLLPDLEAGSVLRHYALLNLANIRKVLALRHRAPSARPQSRVAYNLHDPRRVRVGCRGDASAGDSIPSGANL